MKKYAILAFLLMVCLVIAKTETVELRAGESFEIKDKNVTLMDFSPDDDKVIVCVNNEKMIVSDELERSVNAVTINVKKVTNDYAKLELSRVCTSSKCNCEETEEDCSNIECFNECELDSECDDNDENTNDFCRGSPRKCLNIEIGENECSEDSECIDSDECTEDTCVDGSCVNQEIEGCGEEVPDEVEEEQGTEQTENFMIFIGLLLISIILILIFKIFKGKKR